jgi:hypothetical protein
MWGSIMAKSINRKTAADLQRRRAMERIYDHLFEQKGSLGDPCAYCGAAADTLDHVPPLHWVARMRQLDREVTGAMLIPACAECNAILGGKLFLTMPSRRAHIYERLKAKNHRILRMPEWDEDELAEISPKLARAFGAATETVHDLRARLFWLRVGRP